MGTPRVNSKTHAGLGDDHDPNAMGQKDAQKPQWKQAEGRTAAEKNLKPKDTGRLDDNPHDA
jgi:hypothetical protein